MRITGTLWWVGWIHNWIVNYLMRIRPSDMWCVSEYVWNSRIIRPSYTIITLFFHIQLSFGRLNSQSVTKRKTIPVWLIILQIFLLFLWLQQISKSVFKGMVSLLSMIIHGLEHTFKTNGSGGVASALMVLEVAATHYYVRDSKSNSSSRTSSPFGSRESLVSIGKEGHVTPTRQLQNRHSENYAQQTANKGVYCNCVSSYGTSYVFFRKRECVAFFNKPGKFQFRIADPVWSYREYETIFVMHLND